MRRDAEFYILKFRPILIDFLSYASSYKKEIKKIKLRFNNFTWKIFQYLVSNVIYVI